MYRLCLCLAILIVPGAGPALAQVQAQTQDWVDQVFPERSFDLGSVARGSKLRHSFQVLNKTNQDVRIVDVQKKCGCTDVKIGAREIPPGTKTTIDVELDTTKFSGYKASGVTLILDRPVSRSIDLNLTSFIRSDIVVAPGNVDFGAVPRGEPRNLTLNIQYNGGQANWQIVKIETGPAAVEAELTQTGRTNGSASYQLAVKLDTSALNGAFKDEITLTTNDPNSPVLPLSVTALVQARVTISPATLVLGKLKPGQVVKKTVYARSATPFKVLDIATKKGDLAGAVDDQGSKPLHPIALTFTAPDQVGPSTGSLEVSTDIPGEPPAKLTVFATIVP